MTDDARSAAALRELAPAGPVRIALNLANAAIVTVSPDGILNGPAPRLAEALGAWTGLPIAIERFGSAAEVVAAGQTDAAWDVAFLAIDPARTDRFTFSSPYMTIEVAAAVWTNSPIRSPDDLDRPGVRIASAEGAAYDLQLQRTLKHASRVAFANPRLSRQGFEQQRLEALAGVRQTLDQAMGGRTDIRVLAEPIARVDHAMATPAGRTQAATLLDAFIRDASAHGIATC